MLLIKEFTCKLGFVKLLKSLFKTNDSARLRYHKDDENLWQVIYQILGAYFADDCADELIHDPVLTAILDKKALASQPYQRTLTAKEAMFSLLRGYYARFWVKFQNADIACWFKNKTSNYQGELEPHE